MALWLGSGRRFLQRSWDEAASESLEKGREFVAADVEMQSSTSSEQQQPNALFQAGNIYTSFTFPFHASLVELSWGGWKLVALPLVLKHTLPLFTKVDQERVVGQISRFILAFLAALKRSKKLSPSEVDIVWRERLEKWCIDKISARMEDDEFTEERVSKVMFSCQSESDPV